MCVWFCRTLTHIYIYIYIYILALTPCMKCTDVSMILIDCGSDQQCLNHKIDQHAGRMDLASGWLGSMFRKAGSKWTLQEVVSWKVGFGIWKAGSRLRKPGNCTGLVTSYLIGRLDPEIVRNCTNLVRNSLTGRLDLHEFGKELPYRKAGSAKNW